jgi:hypothetical protein
MGPVEPVVPLVTETLAVGVIDHESVPGVPPVATNELLLPATMAVALPGVITMAEGVAQAGITVTVNVAEEHTVVLGDGAQI